MPRLIAFMAALWFSLPDWVLAAEKSEEARRYRACLAMARDDPNAGYQEGLAWFQTGGGMPAGHCVALAMIGRGDHEGAAIRLEKIAEEIETFRLQLRSDILAQAAQAWTLAKRPTRAERVQTDAIALNPRDPELFVDRAISLMTQEHYEAAHRDLSMALKLAPDFTDALLFRATANRHLNDLDSAWDDLGRALELVPGLPAAILERGILHQLGGSLDSARLDWLAVIIAYPGTSEADVARARIQQMDVVRR